MFCASYRVRLQRGCSFLAQGKSKTLRVSRSGPGCGHPAASFGANLERVELSWSERTGREPDKQGGLMLTPLGRPCGAPHLA